MKCEICEKQEVEHELDICKSCSDELFGVIYDEEKENNELD